MVVVSSILNIRTRFIRFNHTISHPNTWLCSLKHLYVVCICVFVMCLCVHVMCYVCM